MKFSKSLFLAFAGLGLFACSNEDVAENGGMIEGNGMVEVTIQNPTTRSTQPGASGSSVIVEGNITVEVYDAQNQLQGTATIERTSADEQSEYTAQIFGVINPTKVIAYCNDGKAVNDDASISITDMRLQSVPKSIPAYDEETLSTNDIHGEMENSEDGKTYKRYTKSLALQIPVARIELQGVKHKQDHGEGSCKFNELTINGVYLNNIYATKDAASVTANYSWNENSIKDEGIFPILYDVVGEFGVGEDFKSGKAFPTDATNNAFAYNFFAGTGKALPELKIYFNKATSATSDPMSSPRYAIVKSYKKAGGEEMTEFIPGTIYRITNVELEDKHIGPNEGGEDVYGVEVTVEEATWSVTGITADWVEQ